MSFPIIFILGGPGSGKGTVCTALKEKFGFIHTSAGDLLREEVHHRPDSDLCKEINLAMAQGQLVPSTVIIPLLKQQIEQCPADTRGLLIDGFPRNVPQAHLFEESLDLHPTVIIFLELAESVMMERLMSRGKQGSGRIDDNEETARKRFETFRNESVPVVEDYETRLKERVVRINAAGTVEQVFADVLAGLEGKITL
ncbi:adenylate kinase [Nowakowskiella sp. JEL0407]|nr:adenylate kinase [Nowakowskiella sp. JEL0407]